MSNIKIYLGWGLTKGKSGGKLIIHEEDSALEESEGAGRKWKLKSVIFPILISVA